MPACETDGFGWVRKLGEVGDEAQVFGNGQDGRPLGKQRSAAGELQE